MCLNACTFNNINKCQFKKLKTEKKLRQLSRLPAELVGWRHSDLPSVKCSYICKL